MGIPAMTKCCNQLDICYDTCGSNKYRCDTKFRWCLHSICGDLKKSLGFVSKVEGEKCFSAHTHDSHISHLCLLEVNKIGVSLEGNVVCVILTLLKISNFLCYDILLHFVHTDIFSFLAYLYMLALSLIL